LIRPIIRYGSPTIYFGQEHFGVERELFVAFHYGLSAFETRGDFDAIPSFSEESLASGYVPYASTTVLTYAPTGCGQYNIVLIAFFT
jgi:hypothetical protein